MKVWLRRLFVLVAFGVVLYFFLPLVDEVRGYSLLFRRAHWGWLGIAVFLQIISYACLAWLNVLLLRPFGGDISWGRMMAILPPLAFIEVAVPSAGASGVVMRAHLLGRRGYSAEASAFSLLLEAGLLMAVRTITGLTGLLYLVRNRRLDNRQIALVMAVISVVILFIALSILIARDRQRTERWLLALLAQLNRLLVRFKRPPYPEPALRARVDAFYIGLARFSRTPRWPLFLAAIGRVALDVATLYACFWAFRYSVRPGVLLTGYGLMLLLSTFSALPGGLGLADVSLAVLYAELGAPEEVAVVASLSYRLIAFWLLRLVGFVNWQILERVA